MQLHLAFHPDFRILCIFNFKIKREARSPHNKAQTGIMAGTELETWKKIWILAQIQMWIIVSLTYISMWTQKGMQTLTCTPNPFLILSERIGNPPAFQKMEWNSGTSAPGAQSSKRLGGGTPKRDKRGQGGWGALSKRGPFTHTDVIQKVKYQIQWIKKINGKVPFRRLTNNLDCQNCPTSS